MLTFKQRYRPRTEREYTKSDLTVYDSAGNTALNALTVYGKSEVVDGAITSAGEGWATVDLGTLDWLLYNSSKYPNLFYANDERIKGTDSSTKLGNATCPQYTICTSYQVGTPGYTDGYFAIGTSSKVYVNDTHYTDADTFKAAMSGVLLCYELADPTQDNCIAVKTDDGSGINGTMATFTTGTPLYGVGENIRDVMQWDGSAGTVTKKCVKVRLADLTWSENQTYLGGFTTPLSNALPGLGNYISNYSYNTSTAFVWSNFDNLDEHTIYRTTYASNIYIKATDYTSDLTDFVTSLGDAELVYELATPTTEPLTQTENTSIASLRTFDGTTHFTNNADTDMTVNYTIKVPTIS